MIVKTDGKLYMQQQERSNTIETKDRSKSLENSKNNERSKKTQQKKTVFTNEKIQPNNLQNFQQSIQQENLSPILQQDHEKKLYKETQDSQIHQKNQLSSHKDTDSSIQSSRKMSYQEPQALTQTFGNIEDTKNPNASFTIINPEQIQKPKKVKGQKQVSEIIIPQSKTNQALINASFTTIQPEVHNIPKAELINPYAQQIDIKKIENILNQQINSNIKHTLYEHNISDIQFASPQQEIKKINSTISPQSFNHSQFQNTPSIHQLPSFNNLQLSVQVNKPQIPSSQSYYEQQQQQLQQIYYEQIQQQQSQQQQQKQHEIPEQVRIMIESQKNQQITPTDPAIIQMLYNSRNQKEYRNTSPLQNTSKYHQTIILGGNNNQNLPLVNSQISQPYRIDQSAVLQKLPIQSVNQQPQYQSATASQIIQQNQSLTQQQDQRVNISNQKQSIQNSQIKSPIHDQSLILEKVNKSQMKNSQYKESKVDQKKIFQNDTILTPNQQFFESPSKQFFNQLQIEDISPKLQKQYTFENNYHKAMDCNQNNHYQKQYDQQQEYELYKQHQQYDQQQEYELYKQHQQYDQQQEYELYKQHQQYDQQQENELYKQHQQYDQQQEYQYQKHKQQHQNYQQEQKQQQSIIQNNLQQQQSQSQQSIIHNNLQQQSSFNHNNQQQQKEQYDEYQQHSQQFQKENQKQQLQFQNVSDKSLNEEQLYQKVNNSNYTQQLEYPKISSKSIKDDPIIQIYKEQAQFFEENLNASQIRVTKLEDKNLELQNEITRLQLEKEKMLQTNVENQILKQKIEMLTDQVSQKKNSNEGSTFQKKQIQILQENFDVQMQQMKSQYEQQIMDLRTKILKMKSKISLLKSDKNDVSQNQMTSQFSLSPQKPIYQTSPQQILNQSTIPYNGPVYRLKVIQ